MSRLQNGAPRRGRARAAHRVLRGRQGARWTRLGGHGQRHPARGVSEEGRGGGCEPPRHTHTHTHITPGRSAHNVTVLGGLKHLSLVDHPERGTVCIGLSEVAVSSSAKVNYLLQRAEERSPLHVHAAQQAVQTARTASSRSRCAGEGGAAGGGCWSALHRLSPPPPPPACPCRPSSAEGTPGLNASLTLVDLAGSEDVSRRCAALFLLLLLLWAYLYPPPAPPPGQRRHGRGRQGGLAHQQARCSPWGASSTRWRRTRRTSPIRGPAERGAHTRARSTRPARARASAAG